MQESDKRVQNLLTFTRVNEMRVGLSSESDHKHTSVHGGLLLTISKLSNLSQNRK